MGVAPIERFGSFRRALPRTEAKTRLAIDWRRTAVTVVETFKLALDALRAHKLRSFLTLLGVILAVTTLIVVMSIVAGMNFYIADKVANLGANVYIVDRFGITTSDDEWVKAQKRPLLTKEDFEALRGEMKQICKWPRC